MEEQIVDNEKYYCVCSDTNLADKQIDDITNLKVNQLYYPSICQVPVHITKLIASSCCLQEISGVRLMKNLQYLQNLQYLNITNNKVIFSQPLSALPNLQQLLPSNNMIHDFGVLATNKNFSISWICPQKVAFLINFLDYLGPSSTIEQATVLMNNTVFRRDQNPYHDPMLLKYIPQVINRTLIIHNDQELRSIQFTDLMNIDTLFVFECYNLNFERVPTMIKKLAVNMCCIQNINGLENMKSIIELSLRGNRISEISVISRINSIQKLDVAQNNINSIQGIDNLTQLINVDLSENNIIEISSLMSMKQLKTINLSKNKISFAGALEPLTNLNTLNLSYNDLNQITFVKRMTKLIQLDVSFNQIYDIDTIKNLIKLVDLRLDGNMIESFNALESLPNLKWSWYVSEQNAPESDNIRMLVKDCKNKESLGTNYQIFDNKNVKQLGFVDICKPQLLTVTNCPNLSFDNCPRIPIKLKINKCRLVAITGIFEMQQIVELDLGFNNIRHINELEALLNLQVLNLQNNDIYRINVLKNLGQLKYVNLTNNKVIFSQPLNQMKGQLIIDNNLVTDNVSLKNQNKPQLVDFQNFFGPNSTENQVKELAKVNDYNFQMYFRFVQSIANNALNIQNDQVLTDFGFTAEMNINTLNVQNCQNVKFPQQAALQYLQKDSNGALINWPEVILHKTPKQITSLTIINCKLTNIIGIENMKQLLYLNLKDNCIISIEQLDYLTNLKQVFINNNYVQDLEYLRNPDWISLQNNVTDANIQAYLTDINSNLTVQAFKAKIAPKKEKSNQLIAPLQYDECLQKYNQAISGSPLEMKNYILYLQTIKNQNVCQVYEVQCYFSMKNNYFFCSNDVWMAKGSMYHEALLIKGTPQNGIFAFVFQNSKLSTIAFNKIINNNIQNGFFYNSEDRFGTTEFQNNELKKYNIYYPNGLRRGIYECANGMLQGQFQCFDANENIIDHGIFNCGNLESSAQGAMFQHIWNGNKI
ncbi:leucine-rich_repeat domain-containing protein [Hexamita inflata]|uniref:Leucine-rich repeat domain-containing protein n=1 Tax=Hexamita inflata TaxID=28002 RepID=A0AA86NQE0_9EUKA|nr:leucine-rich repeat domain-containing protein [Hexamita inflata]